MSGFKTLFSLKDTDSFSNGWSGIQSIITILAIFGGSIWTVYNFTALGQKAKADLEIAEMKSKEPALDFELKTSEKGRTQDNHHYIEIVVQIKNVGSRDVVMCFEDPDKEGKSNCSENVGDPCKSQPGVKPFLQPIEIHHAILEPDKLVFNKENIEAIMYRPDCPQAITGMRIQVGQTESYTAAVALKPGFYRVVFYSYVTPKQIEAAASPSHETLPPHSRPFWRATAFVSVEDATLKSRNLPHPVVP